MQRVPILLSLGHRKLTLWWSIFTVISILAFYCPGRALVGAQQHFVLGGFLCATALLFNQELLKSAGGEGESLSPELH